VTYRSNASAMTDLLGGQIQVVFATTLAAIEYLKVGTLRALAVTTATRSDVLLNTPTVGEFLPGYEASGWWGIGAPRNTSASSTCSIRKSTPCRSQAEGAPCRPGRHGVSALARRVRQVRCRRNREVGEGGQVFWREGRLSRGPDLGSGLLPRQKSAWFQMLRCTGGVCSGP
jgi:hypothetical protein